MSNRDARPGPASTKLTASSAHAQRVSPAGRQIRTPSIATPATANTHSHDRAIVVRHAATPTVHGSATPVARLPVPYSLRRNVASRSDGVVIVPHDAGPSANTRYA